MDYCVAILMFNTRYLLSLINSLSRTDEFLILMRDRDHYNFGWGRYYSMTFFFKKKNTNIFFFLYIRRMCPAIYLAETEIFSAFVQIYSRCMIEPTSNGFPDIGGARVGSLTITPVHFTKRSNALI